jgi:hypothetical protein
VGGNVYTHDHLSVGRMSITEDDGTLLSRRLEPIPHQNGDYALNGQAAFDAGGGRLTVTGQVAWFDHDEQFSILTTSPAGA